MALLSGIFRIGRDPEMRYLPNGDGVLTLAVVYNYGKKGEDGNRPSQWLDCALFGKRAESLQPYLTKGSQVSLVIQDPHNESYKTKDGREGVRFAGRILDIELIGQRQQSSSPEKPDKQSNITEKQVKQSYDDFDDGIPF